MKLSPFQIILIIAALPLACYLMYIRFKAEMALYGDDFWPAVVGGCIMAAIYVAVIYSIGRK